MENHLTNRSASKGMSTLLPVLLLFGSFTFAFCLGEAVHELGHCLAHRAYGYEVGIILDPFGGSRTLGSSSPREIWGITTVAGPLFNLLLGITLFLFLWPKRRPGLLPFLLWGPLSLIQEGVNFSLGLLTPGGDAELIVEWGVPMPILLALGVLFLAFGIILVSWLLPLLNVSPDDTSGRKFTVVTGGMVSFMVLRWLFAAASSPESAQENFIPLLFSLLLATIVMLIYRPLHSFLRRWTEIEPVAIGWTSAALSVALGVGMIVFQLIAFN